MAATQEDSFREIQLSGKALVFVFMAGVVILVTVFLMGLLVGRGVLATRGPAGAVTTAAAEVEPPAPPAAAAVWSTSPATAGENSVTLSGRIGEPRRSGSRRDTRPRVAQNRQRESASSASARTKQAAIRDPAGATSVASAAGLGELPEQSLRSRCGAREKDEADVDRKRLPAKG